MEIQGDTAKRPDIGIAIDRNRRLNGVQISFWWGQGGTVEPHPRRYLTLTCTGMTRESSIVLLPCVQAQYLSSIAWSTGRLVSPCPSAGSSV